MAKKILKEAVVRRFQKLANVSPINEMYTQHESYMNEEEAGEDAGAEDMGAPEGEEMDMGDEGESELELPKSDIEAIAAALPALQTIAAAADGDMGEEEVDMDDMGMDAEAPADEEGAEDDAADAIMEALRGISYVPSKSEIVNEVAQRVARRLQTAKLHEAKLNRALGRRK
jgi:hypothetical protein